MAKDKYDAFRGEQCSMGIVWRRKERYMQYLPSEQSRLADDEEMMARACYRDSECSRCFCRVIREMKASVAVQDLWRHCLDQCSISAGRDLKQQHNGRLWNIIRLQHILKTRLMIVNTNGHCAINQCHQHATNHITLHSTLNWLIISQAKQKMFLYIHTHTNGYLVNFFLSL